LTSSLKGVSQQHRNFEQNLIISHPSHCLGERE
jgi:hypothetical protein